MLDVFTFTIPASTLAWATRVGGGGHYGGAFAMGSVSGLVAAPCGAPVMAAVLTWVTRTQSAALGFSYLFVFSLGMCALLVVVGVSSGSAAGLPKAGAWMLRVKRIFGFVMLGVAEYYLIKMGQVLL
jgi:thiol:disulfide interchange protein DsbD